MHIGNRLKKTRRLKKLSQADVCKGIVSPSHYSNIESGRYDASEDILDLIAKRLKVPTFYFKDIHKDSKEIEELLSELANEVQRDIEDASSFIEKNINKLEYIFSIKQEVSYLLISCHLQLRLGQISKAKQLHEELSFYIKESNIHSLSKESRFNYFYVTALLKYYDREFNNSFSLYEKALHHTDSKKDIGKILFNQALICFNVNESQKGLQYALEAKNIYLNLHHWKETIDTYILLGILYMEVKEYTKADEVLNRGLNLALEQKLIAAQGKIFHNLGMIHFQQKDYEKSLVYFKKGLNIRLELDPNSTFLPYITITKIYLITNETKKYSEYYNKASAVSKGEYENFLLQALEAKRAYNEGNFRDYEILMEQTIKYFYSNRYWMDLLDVTKEFSEYQYKLRKYKKAFDYLKIELEATQEVYKERSS